MTQTQVPQPAPPAPQYRSPLWDEYWHRKRQPVRDAVTAFAEVLTHVEDPVARAVLDIHTDDDAGRGEMWPCRTVLAAATTLGIPVPAHLQ